MKHYHAVWKKLIVNPLLSVKPPQKKTCPVFDRRKMLSVNSDPQCENKKKNAQCDFSYSM